MTPIPPSPPVAGTLPELPEPTAWGNFNVLTQKETFGRMPITALQPGIYKHRKLYDESAVFVYALAAIAAHEAGVGRLREVILEGARRMEDLKRPCGADPESSINIQNSRYMGVSYFLRAAISPINQGNPS